MAAAQLLWNAALPAWTARPATIATYSVQQNRLAALVPLADGICSGKWSNVRALDCATGQLCDTATRAMQNHHVAVSMAAPTGGAASLRCQTAGGAEPRKQLLAAARCPSPSSLPLVPAADHPAVAQPDGDGSAHNPTARAVRPQASSLGWAASWGTSTARRLLPPVRWSGQANAEVFGDSRQNAGARHR